MSVVRDLWFEDCRESVLREPVLLYSWGEAQGANHAADGAAGTADLLYMVTV